MAQPLQARPLFTDSFTFVDSYGIPLALVMQEASTMGQAVDIKQFIKDAIAHGWTKEKAIATANEAVNMLRSEHCYVAV